MREVPLPAVLEIADDLDWNVAEWGHDAAHAAQRQRKSCARMVRLHGVTKAEIDRYASPVPVQVYIPEGSLSKKKISQEGGALTQVGGLTSFQAAQKTQAAAVSHSVLSRHVSL
jgi:hypothetical protein